MRETQRGYRNSEGQASQQQEEAQGDPISQETASRPSHGVLQSQPQQEGRRSSAQLVELTNRPANVLHLLQEGRP